VQAFDWNLDFFTKSWELNIEVLEKLWINPLGALSVVELYLLRGILQSKWQYIFQVQKVDG